jgi:murein DD-endopeptidase MepM/ murein hydrolase activator NlpD
MRRTRLHRRRARDEMLAPWIAAAVILGGWGLAARFIAPERVPAPAAFPPAAIAEPSPPPITAEPNPPAKVENPAPPAHASLDAPTPAPAASDPDVSRDVAALRERNLLIPVAGVDRAALVSSFSDARGSSRVHEALDVLAPRGTPVVAVETGTIVKLFRSVRGGTTIYQFDPSGAYCYYYAHLDRYESGLGEGDTVERGQIIGYVGTTGNAPPGTPHLHFAIFRLGPERQWWEGVPIDPYLVLR